MPTWDEDSPIELAPTAHEVLRRCGYGEDNLPPGVWEKLGKLANLRTGAYSPPTSMHTPWRVLPKDEVFDAPSLSTFLKDVAVKHIPRKAKDLRVWEKDPLKEKGTTYGPMTQLRMKAFTRSILADERLEKRLICLSCETPRLVSQHVISQSEQKFQRLVKQYFGERNCDSSALVADITPKGLFVTVMTDPAPALCVAEAMTDSTGPCILWLTWPSTETHKLPSCLYNAADALGKFDHGAFTVQLPGEGLLSPSQSPYAYMALQSTGLYVKSFQPKHSCDPMSPLVELDDEPDKTAFEQRRSDVCEAYLAGLEAGLEDPQWRLRYAEQLAESWPQLYALMSFKNFHLRMAEVLQQDIEATGECVLCLRTGADILYDNEIDFSDNGNIIQHIEQHGWFVDLTAPA